MDMIGRGIGTWHYSSLWGFAPAVSVRTDLLRLIRHLLHGQTLAAQAVLTPIHSMTAIGACPAPEVAGIEVVFALIGGGGDAFVRFGKV